MKKTEKDKIVQSDERITNLVEMVFQDIPYSDEIMKAQEKIVTALNEEFEKASKNESDTSAFEDILTKYGNLENMAVLAGYTKEEAKNGDTGVK